MLERGSGVLNDFSCHSSGSPIWELESDCRMRNYIRDNILRLYWCRLQSSTRLGNAMITFFVIRPRPMWQEKSFRTFSGGSGNGGTWFLYSKRRLLTQHIQEFLQVTPGPFPNFMGGAWGRGYESRYRTCIILVWAPSPLSSLLRRIYVFHKYIVNFKAELLQICMGCYQDDLKVHWKGFISCVTIA